MVRQGLCRLQIPIKGIDLPQVESLNGPSVERLNQYLRGWMGYFGISQYYQPIPELDGWLRRRIRMCYWKQWRKPRTRIRKLLELGTDRRHAISTGISRKGYWRLARTLATQTGMTNQWLAQQGLVSIRDLWIKAQGYVSSRQLMFAP